MYRIFSKHTTNTYRNERKKRTKYRAGFDPKELNKSQNFVQLFAGVANPEGVKANDVDEYAIDDRTLRRYITDFALQVS